MWCLKKLTAGFIASMELILQLYALPYDPQYPVVCFDERPCQLLASVTPDEPMQPGKCQRQDSEYKRCGTCCILASIEPLTGKRIVQVQTRRRNKEFALFMQELARAYPQATRVKVVLDNLSTHTYAAFYQHLPATEAFALMNKLEFVYTPKKASWLNMIEIEFSALSRMCLNRRIPTLEELNNAVVTFMEDRTKKGVKITWQFTVAKAREKMNRAYAKVFQGNEQYIKT